MICLCLEHLKQTRKIRRYCAGAAVAIYAFATPVLAGIEYSIKDLGTFSASAINSSGEVVGTNSSGESVLYSGGTLTALPIFQSTGSQALGINDSGQIAGYSNDYKAYIYSGGGLTILGTLGGNESAASGINSSGTVVGWSQDAAGTQTAFLYSGGIIKEITGGNSFALAVNNNGDVTGWTGNESSAFVYGAGHITILPRLPNEYAIRPTSINDPGAVAGEFSYSNGTIHAFLFDDGDMADLGTLGGGSSYATGLNSAGEVVGYSTTPGNDSFDAFVDVNDVMVDLNMAIPNDSGWFLGEANAINESGQIVGDGIFNGQDHAFLLTPLSSVPEPRLWPFVAAILVLLVPRSGNPKRVHGPF